MKFFSFWYFLIAFTFAKQSIKFTTPEKDQVVSIYDSLNSNSIPFELDNTENIDFEKTFIGLYRYRWFWSSLVESQQLTADMTAFETSRKLKEGKYFLKLFVKGMFKKHTIVKSPVFTVKMSDAPAPENSDNSPVVGTETDNQEESGAEVKDQAKPEETHADDEESDDEEYRGDYQDENNFDYEYRDDSEDEQDPFDIVPAPRKKTYAELFQPDFYPADESEIPPAPMEPVDDGFVPVKSSYRPSVEKMQPIPFTKNPFNALEVEEDPEFYDAEEGDESESSDDEDQVAEDEEGQAEEIPEQTVEQPKKLSYADMLKKNIETDAEEVDGDNNASFDDTQAEDDEQIADEEQTPENDENSFDDEEQNPDAEEETPEIYDEQEENSEDEQQGDYNEKFDDEEQDAQQPEFNDEDSFDKADDDEIPEGPAIEKPKKMSYADMLKKKPEVVEKIPVEPKKATYAEILQKPAPKNEFVDDELPEPKMYDNEKVPQVFKDDFTPVQTKYRPSVQTINEIPTSPNTFDALAEEGSDEESDVPDLVQDDVTEPKSQPQEDDFTPITTKHRVAYPSVEPIPTDENTFDALPIEKKQKNKKSKAQRKKAVADDSENFDSEVVDVTDADAAEVDPQDQDHSVIHRIGKYLRFW